MMEKHLLEIVDIKDENTRTKTYYLKKTLSNRLD